ncbi:DUF6153 family protein [Streptomyces sp. NPDC059176]|uniref:DUF6153 family protein n=1 Tax=unclassified Streptomyces TaxID=2593676 RepID=UPI0036C57F8B
MVTAWTPSSKPRTGLAAGPLRVLWLAVLLFGLLYTHGVSAETAASHATTSAAMPAAHFVPGSDAAREDDQPTSPGHDGGDQDSHPAGECVSGQPQQGSGLPAPAPAPLDLHSFCLLTVVGKSSLPGDRSALPPPRSTAHSVIQLI